MSSFYILPRFPSLFLEINQPSLLNSTLHSLVRCDPMLWKPIILYLTLEPLNTHHSGDPGKIHVLELYLHITPSQYGITVQALITSFIRRRQPLLFGLDTPFIITFQLLYILPSIPTIPRTTQSRCPAKLLAL